MSREIINLTNHKVTEGQIEAGVFDLDSENINALHELLTFDEMPDDLDMYRRAKKICSMIPDGITKAMIAPAPWFCSVLENFLRINGVTPMYAFSKRNCKEVTTEDGTIQKVSEFKHLGFISK